MCVGTQDGCPVGVAATDTMAHPDSGERQRHPWKPHTTVHTDALEFYTSWEKDSTLATVEEIASTRRTILREMGIMSQGFKRGH